MSNWYNNTAMQIIWSGGGIPLPTPAPYCYLCAYMIDFLFREGNPNHTIPVIGSIANVANGELFTVFPNPASGTVIFTYNVPHGGSSLVITITNMLGEKVATIITSGNQGKTAWDTRSQPAGIYLYQATGDEGTIQMGKLVIVK